MNDFKPRQVSRTLHRRVVSLAAALLVWILGMTGFAEIQFEGVEPLPDILIDGKPVRLHTQGLFVTDKHFLVTARLETLPKRAMLVRFERGTNKYELLDITPPKVDGETLDHPGGFDQDSGDVFWIPLSTSHRRGPTIVARYRIRPDVPLEDAELEESFYYKDHLGAICVLANGALAGANWDTLEIAKLSPNGDLESRKRQADLWREKRPAIAVQDWKRLRDDSNRVVMGGLQAGPREKEAVVMVANLEDGTIASQFRLPRLPDVRKPVTNEGLHVHRDKLYLLPEDLGDSAKVLRYRFELEDEQTK